VSPDETTETVQRTPGQEVRDTSDERPTTAGTPPGAILRIDEARRRRIRPWAIAGATLVALATGSVALSYTSLFGARVIEVEGEKHLGPKQVMRLAGIEHGTNVIHLDTTVAEARLEAEPWVLDASIETDLPGTVRIDIRERRPIMVVARDGAVRLFAADGTDLGRAPRSSGLPGVEAAPGEVLGPSSIATAGEVVEAMAPLLRTRIDAVLVTADGRVDLLVDGGVDVRFGAPEEAMAKGQALRAILVYAEEQGRRLVSIDLSAPAAPTARFAGEGKVRSVPDPSAHASTTATEADDEQAGAEPSPSP
jgi:cell division protein FtsQ